MVNKRIKKYKNYILSFLIPIIFLLVILVITHVYPFGNNTVVMGDMKHQYIALMTYFKNNITHLHNFLYSYQIGLGMGFFSVLSYYLMNPLNLLTILFPNSAMPTFFMINTLVNVGLLGLTTFTFLYNSVYLNKNKIKNKTFWTILLSMCFTFSSFFANYQECIMWVNAIVLLPLVLLGLDHILYNDQKNNTWLYWVTLSSMILINWYIGVMGVILLFISMIFWVIRQLWNKEIKVTFYKGIKVLLLSLLSIGIGVIVMIPSYLAQKSVTQATFKLSFKPIYHFHSFFSALLNGNSDPAAPLIFCGMLPVVLFALFFFDSKINYKQRILTFIYSLFIILSTYLTAFYMMWHSFSMPNGFVQRESFIVSFVLICIGYESLNMVNNVGNFKYCLIVFLSIFLITVISNYKYHNFTLDKIKSDFVILLLLLGAFYLIAHKGKLIGYTFIALITGLELFVFNFRIDKTNFAEVPQSAYSYSVRSFNDTIRNLKQKDNSFYRVGSTAEVTPNDPLLFDYNGVQAYVSQQPTSMTNYISALGYYQKHSWIRWNTFNNGSTAAINNLLGIKYFLEADPKLLLETQKVDSMPTTNTTVNSPNIKKFSENNGIKVYKNQEAFPLAFQISHNALNDTYNYDPQADPFDYYNSLFKSIDENINKPIYTTENCIPQVNGNDLIYNVNMPQSGNVYVYLAHPQINFLNIGPQGKESLSFEVNGKDKGLYGGKNCWGENGILYIGSFKKNDQVKIVLKNGKLLNQPFKLIIGSENQKLVEKIHKYAVNDCIQNIKVNGDVITFKTTNNYPGGWVALSMTYDPNWRGVIDSKSTQIYKALGDLNALYIPQGKHIISLKYITKGLKLGIIISIISFMLLCGYEIKKHSDKHRH